MSRPFECRRVAFMPGVTYFKPAGIPIEDLEETLLSIEEVEALRLKELEGLEQEQGAKKMNSSRQTFQRILASARHNIVDALLNGNAIRIEGGNFEISHRQLRCTNGHKWESHAENLGEVSPKLCPVRKAAAIELPVTMGFGGKGRGWRRRKRLTSDSNEVSV
jgi:predicted DNA-binding protein (UPF0251 family)